MCADVANTDELLTLDDWLPWLETLSPREIVLGLERVDEVLGRLDLEPARTVVAIAGTNGKGSCAAMLEALFREGGLTTGCYTSPHLVRYNERIRINGSEAGDAAILAALRAVESARRGVPLTFFEFGTLAALVAFANAGVDAWILEVGMGGRLDAVNAVPAHASLISSIGLDHCAWLGNDIESIAREKAGIMRGNVPTVFAAATMPPAVGAVAEEKNALLIRAGRDYTFERDAATPGRWHWRGRTRHLEGLDVPALPGNAQLANAAAVLALTEALGLSGLLEPDRVSRALRGLTLEGRHQVVQRRCRWILDVAHNADAAAVLAELLGDHVGDGRVTAVIGMLADKDVAAVVAAIGSRVDRWIAAPTPGSRGGPALPVATTIAGLTGRPCQVAASPQAAFERADALSDAGDTVLVTGSFYIVGPALTWLGIHPPPAA